MCIGGINTPSTHAHRVCPEACRLHWAALLVCKHFTLSEWTLHARCKHHHIWWLVQSRSAGSVICQRRPACRWNHCYAGAAAGSVKKCNAWLGRISRSQGVKLRCTGAAHHKCLMLQPPLLSSHAWALVLCSTKHEGVACDSRRRRPHLISFLGGSLCSPVMSTAAHAQSIIVLWLVMAATTPCAAVAGQCLAHARAAGVGGRELISPLHGLPRHFNAITSHATRKQIGLQLVANLSRCSCLARHRRSFLSVKNR